MKPCKGFYQVGSEAWLQIKTSVKVNGGDKRSSLLQYVKYYDQKFVI